MSAVAAVMLAIPRRRAAKVFLAILHRGHVRVRTVGMEDGGSQRSADGRCSLARERRGAQRESAEQAENKLVHVWCRSSIRASGQDADMWHRRKMADRPAPVSNADAALDQAIAERDAEAQELFETKRFATQLAIERQHLRDSVDTLRVRERDAAHAEFGPLLDAARRERDAAMLERDAAIVERDRARAVAHDATAMLDRVTSSTAWRMTGPARRLLETLRRR